MKDRKVVMVWEGKNNTFWVKMAHWIGVGWIYTHHEVSKSWFEAYNELN
jgi:hypothetical protein